MDTAVGWKETAANKSNGEAIHDNIEEMELVWKEQVEGRDKHTDGKIDAYW
jgi:hypothetical protein